MQPWILKSALCVFLAAAGNAWAQSTTTSQPAGGASAASPWIRISTKTTQVGVSPVVQLLNTENGLSALLRDTGDNLQIQFQDPRTMDFWDYTVAAKEIRRGDLSPWLKTGLLSRAKNVLATNAWDASKLRWKTLLADNWQEVTPTTEDGLQRYDLAKAIPALEQASRPAQPFSAVPDTVWVDPASNLIRKTVKHYANAARGWDVTITYDYHVAPVDDLYSLGIPRDARIVDNRPAAETRAVLERVETRINHGLGDYVGVYLDAMLMANGTADTSRASIRLLARKGNRGLVSNYNIISRTLPNHPGIALPDNWPDIDLPAFITALRAAVPNTYTWYANGKPESGRFLRGRMDTSATTPIEYSTAMQSTNIGLFIWPELQNFNRYTPETQVKLLTDDQHPNQVGLQVTRFGPCNDFYLSQTIYWIDPTRADVLMSSETTAFRAGSALNRLDTTERRTLEVKALGDGRYYPARWQIAVKRATPEGFLDPVTARDYRLLLMPAVDIDASWVPHVADPDATQPAPTQPTTAPSP